MNSRTHRKRSDYFAARVTSSSLLVSCIPRALDYVLWRREGSGSFYKRAGYDRASSKELHSQALVRRAGFILTKGTRRVVWYFKEHGKREERVRNVW
jgi:hypothetical protein